MPKPALWGQLNGIKMVLVKGKNAARTQFQLIFTVWTTIVVVACSLPSLNFFIICKLQAHNRMTNARIRAQLSKPIKSHTCLHIMCIVEFISDFVWCWVPFVFSVFLYLFLVLIGLIIYEIPISFIFHLGELQQIQLQRKFNLSTICTAFVAIFKQIWLHLEYYSRWRSTRSRCFPKKK